MLHGDATELGTWHLVDNKPRAVYLRKLISSIMFDNMAQIEVAYDPSPKKTLKTITIRGDKTEAMENWGQE